MSATSSPAVLDPDLAATLARGYLVLRMPRRWNHTCGVALAAERLARKHDLDDRDTALLMSAVWLHDIGYASRASGLGWHPLDGAALLTRWGQPEIAALVAWQTTVPEEAVIRGDREAALLGEYVQPDGVVADLLTIADVTTGADGERCTLGARLVGIRARRGTDSVEARAFTDAYPRLEALLARY